MFAKWILASIVALAVGAVSLGADVNTTQPSDVDLLQVENAKLRTEVAELRAELTAAKDRAEAVRFAFKAYKEKHPANDPDNVADTAPKTDGELHLGMTIADCDRIEAARKWIRHSVEEGEDSAVVEYRFTEVDGVERTDVCWFVDGKLSKLKKVSPHKNGNR